MYEIPLLYFNITHYEIENTRAQTHRLAHANTHLQPHDRLKYADSPSAECASDLFSAAGDSDVGRIHSSDLFPPLWRRPVVLFS